MTIPSSKRWRLKIRNFSGTSKQWRLSQFSMFIAATPVLDYGLPPGSGGLWDMTSYTNSHGGYPGSYEVTVTGSSEATFNTVTRYEQSFDYSNPLIETSHTAYYSPACANGDQRSNGIPPFPGGGPHYNGLSVPIYNLGGGNGTTSGPVFPYMTSPWVTADSPDDQYIEYEFATAVQVANYYVTPQINEPVGSPWDTTSGGDDDYYRGYPFMPTDWDLQFWDDTRWVTIDRRRGRTHNWGSAALHPETGALLGYFSPSGGWERTGWYAVSGGHCDQISIDQLAVEVLRDNGDPQHMDFEQLAVEVLRFNGEEIGTGTIDEFPGDNPATGDWFSMF